MKILLTGGTGFIGSYILMDLLKAGHEVTVLARNVEKIPALKRLSGVRLFQGEMMDLGKLEEAVKGQEGCIHVALNYNDRSGLDMLKSDTLPSVALGDYAAKAGVRHFIYTSSTAANDNVYMTERPRFEGPIHNVYAHTKQNPVTFYGATKAAVENYRNALSHQSGMRVNVVRPGYTFGNPVIEGASTQADTRFKDIARNARENRDIRLVKSDGTQFIWAGDLSKIYTAILESDVNRKTYFGLSSGFVSWERIAHEAVRLCGSKSQIIVEDQGWSEEPILFDVSGIQQDFNLDFDPWPRIQEHLRYYLS